VRSIESYVLLVEQAICFILRLFQSMNKAKYALHCSEYKITKRWAPSPDPVDLHRLLLPGPQPVTVKCTYIRDE